MNIMIFRRKNEELKSTKWKNEQNELEYSTNKTDMTAAVAGWSGYLVYSITTIKTKKRNQNYKIAARKKGLKVFFRN